VPTVFTHALIPIAAGLALGKRRLSVPVLAIGTLLAVLPDADVIGFKLGIAYADQLGHRGASHSLLVAAVGAGLVTAVVRPVNWKLIFVFLLISMASHGILDAFTSGGLGPALLWPVDANRYFAPVAPIRVSPIGLGFFTVRGAASLLSEVLWVWLPVGFLAVSARLLLRWKD
jgi:inner membrane protein